MEFYPGRLLVAIATAFPIMLILYVLSVALIMIYARRDPTRTLSWLLLIYLLPGLGLLLYFFLGRNHRKRTLKSGWWQRLAERSDPLDARIRNRYAGAIAEGEMTAEESGFTEVLRLAENGEDAFPLPAYDVRILASGGEKFDQLKKDLAAAQDSINLMYFIWERDELTRALIEILAERARAGVEVRMLNDYLGNLLYRKDQLKERTAAGGRVSYDVRDLGRANYRNHRKIVVIDGVVGYTGGCNVGQEYIDGGKRYPAWRHPPDVWRACCGRPAEELRRTLAGCGEGRPLHRSVLSGRVSGGERSTPSLTVTTGVDAEWEVARRAHVVGIGEASRRVWI